MLTRLTALDGEAILPLAEAKAQVRVVNMREDGLIAALRDAAVGQVERMAGVALAPTQYRWSMPYFPARVDLPVRPVTVLGDVEYLDAEGAVQAYTEARLIGNSVYPAVDGDWPASYGGATIEFTAGFTDPADAPELIAAAKLLVGHLFAHREASTERAMEELPLGIDMLVGTYRQVLV